MHRGVASAWAAFVAPSINPGNVPIPTMPKPKLTFEIFFISMAVILLEVGYTRVFSYKLVY
jgi:hypothetical protein